MNFFGQKFFMVQNCHEINKGCFWGLLWRLKSIFNAFWTIYDIFKFLKILNIFGSKKPHFSLSGSHFENFANFIFELNFRRKSDRKCFKMVVLSFSRSQTLLLCNVDPHWTNLNFDFFTTFLTKIVPLIQKCLGLINMQFKCVT